MFEDKTIENLHDEVLSNVDDKYEKSVGFLTYDVTKSFAIQANIIYQYLQLLFDKLDVEKLEGEELTKYVFQRKGIERNEATFAVGVVTVTGTGTVNVGDLFETPNGIQFVATEQVNIISSGNVNVQCTISGEIGNVGANSITLIPVTITGITSVNNALPTENGFEEETDASLRARYYIALRKPPTSGNKYHYLSWALDVSGVGGAKVFSLWDGPNTVKVVIIDANKQPANNTLVEQVQLYIDPKGTYDAINDIWSTWGTGSGQAPVGAYCSVISAVALPITIEVAVVKSSGYTDLQVANNITANITTYLKEIAFKDITKQDFISYARIGSIILDTEGVEDYTTLELNNGTVSITVGEEEIAILQDVILL